MNRSIFTIAASILLIATTATANAGWFSNNSSEERVDVRIMDKYEIPTGGYSVRICRRMNESDMGYQFLVTYTNSNPNGVHHIVNVIQVMNFFGHGAEPATCRLN